MREAAAVRRGRDGVDGATSAHPLPSAPAAGVLFGDVHVATLDLGFSPLVGSR